MKSRNEYSVRLKQPLLRLFLFLLSALNLAQAFAAIPLPTDPHCSGRPWRRAAECHAVTQRLFGGGDVAVSAGRDLVNQAWRFDATGTSRAPLFNPGRLSAPTNVQNATPLPKPRHFLSHRRPDRPIFPLRRRVFSACRL